MQHEILIKSHIATHIGVSLSFLERNIFNSLYYNAINGNNNHKTESIITIQKLLALLSIKTRNYSHIYKAIKTLTSTVAEWGILKKNTFEGNLTGIPMIIKYNINNGIIRYCIAEELLNNLEKGYVKLNMSTLRNLKTAASVAIYENCASYADIGQTGWVPINDFRKLAGITIDKYGIFKDLHGKVIKPAVNDINKHSEFILHYGFQRQARKVVSIKFNIIKKNLHEVKAEKKIVSDKLQIYGFTPKAADKIITRYSEEYIDDKISLVKDRNDIKNVPAYLTAALTNDFRKIDDRAYKNLDFAKIEIDFKEYQKNEIYKWLANLNDGNWNELKNILVNYYSSITIIPTLVELFIKAFTREKILVFDSCEYQEAADIILGYFRIGGAANISHMSPPKFLSWKEFIERFKKDI